MRGRRRVSPNHVVRSRTKTVKLVRVGSGGPRGRGRNVLGYELTHARLDFDM
jgi:hypothetical protein